MAKNSESIEGKYAIWKCIGCGHNHYIHKDSYTQDGLRCEECRGLVKMDGFTNREDVPLYEPYKRRKSNVGELKLNIDVSNALKGLKAVQREAKKTARVLREVEELSDKRLIDNLTEKEIFKELVKRGWELEENMITELDDTPYLSIVKLEKLYGKQN